MTLHHPSHVEEFLNENKQYLQSSCKMDSSDSEEPSDSETDSEDESSLTSESNLDESKAFSNKMA